jgi:hypothetical protein
MATRIGGIDRRDGFATLVESEFLSRSQTLMEADLKKSNIDDNDLFCTALAHPPVPMANPTWVLGAYRIPYWNREGNMLAGMYRDKLFYRPGVTERQLKESQMGKYRGPSSEQAGLSGADARMPYLLPGGTARVGVICEGEKKAAAALNRFSVNVLGIGGCWNWTDGSDRRGLHEDIIWWATRAGREVIIVVADPDISTRQEIAQGYSGLKRRLQALNSRLTVRVVALTDKIDDFLVGNSEYGLEQLLAESEVAGLELSLSVRDIITEYDLVARTNAAGVVSVVKNAFNVHALLSSHPNWVGNLKFNSDYGVYEFFGKAFVEGNDDHQITAVFNKHLHLPDISLRMVRDGVRAVCLENTYSPAIEDITSCGEWDGKERMKFIFGEGRTEQEIEIARALVVGYIRRVLQPGCFWRYMVILVGKQGVGKTGMSKWLAGDERRVAIFEHGELDRADKDVLIRLMRAKIALFDDVDTFDQKERGKLKRLVTQTHTLQRGAYREMEQFHARGGIMVGTSNHREIIPDDPTGNTRFLVIELMENQDFEWLNVNRTQIIAEGRQLAESSWEPQIDFETMDRFTEQSLVHTKVDEFLEHAKEGGYARNSLVIEGRRSKWFKSELFWIFYGGGVEYKPKLWEIKEFTQRMRALGLEPNVSRGSSVDRDKNGGTIKRVWRLP